MKNIKIIVFMLSITISSIAQQKLEKISQSINVNKDVVIDLNTTHTNIEIDTWNKDVIEVEVYIESDKLSKEELQKVFDTWQVSVEGSKSLVTIESRSSLNSWSNGLALFDDNSLDALKELEFKLADIPEMPIVDGLMESLDLKNMPKIPNLPDLPKGMNNFNFDYDAYKENGEEYLKKWSKEYEEKYGKEYSKKMEAWAEKFDEKEWEAYEKKMEVWGEKFGKEFGDKFEKDMEKWGEEFGKSMEEWGKQFEEQLKESGFEEKMEAWGEELGKHIEKQLEAQGQLNDEGNYLFNSSNKSNLKVKKTIKIKIPKKAKLKMNVRHGELRVSNVIHDMKGDVNHASLLLNSVDGGDTSINASYSSVLVNNWNSGSLHLNYVEDALLKNVDQLMLNSNSSNINIDYIRGNAIIDGSFGDLTIHNLIDTFTNLNIVIENSDARIKLPDYGYSLFYKGTRSKFNNELISNKNINNYPKDSDNKKSIVINAKYSNVIAQ